MKIAIYGGSEGPKTAIAKKGARQVGKLCAQAGVTIVTGACPGIPDVAVRAAAKYGGKCIGYSPARNRREHIKRDKWPTDGYTELHFVPWHYTHAHDALFSRKQRNLFTFWESDAAIIIGGETGTLNEFTLCCDKMNMVIGVLTGTGGITDGLIQYYMRTIDKWKRRNVSIILNPIPRSLLDLVILEVKAKRRALRESVEEPVL